MSRYKNVTVIKNGIRFVVRGHAIYRGIHRGLLRKNKNDRSKADRLIELYIQNIPDESNIRTEYKHDDDIFVQINHNSNNPNKEHILTVKHEFKGKLVAITSVWTTKIYRDKIRNINISRQASDDIKTLPSYPIYCKV